MTVYEPWNPLGEVEARFIVEGIHDDYEHMRIILKEDTDNGRTLRLLFDSVVSYRNINESFRGRTWRSHTLSERSLYVVKESEWMSSLSTESDGLLEGAKHTHYAIYSDEDCIDIISEFEPKVTWLNG